MEELAAELTAGLARLRKGYVDSAEALIRIIDPAGEYPYEFVVYRLTGFRMGAKNVVSEPIGGRVLRAELARLMLDLCDSLDIHASEYAEPVYDITALAKRYSVSTKTIQRWRGGGLPAWRLVLSDGTKRLAFLESSVEWFIQTRGRQRIGTSSRFSQMTAWEKSDILRRARRMAGFTRCSLSEVAHRIASRTGRAVETIRYTLRRHDLDHPDAAIFPNMTGPLARQERASIYHAFLGGASASQLARQYRRTRGSIYRIVNEMRAGELLSRKIGYVYNAQYDLPNADEVILSDEPAAAAAKATGAATPPKGAEELPPYLQALYDVPLLDAAAERKLFRRYNYLKYKADKVRKLISVHNPRPRELKEVEALLIAANTVKNRIIRANLRLVVSIAKKHVGGAQSLFELISDGNVSLMRAVEKFDYTRGNRFSTYASWAIIRNFARSVPRERFQLDHFSTGQDESMDIVGSLKAYESDGVNVPELRESIEAALAKIPPLERTVLINHYGLDEGGSKTLEQLGKQMGVSKERVRQIEINALKKLRKILALQKNDLLS
jgi:RNA polymerase primary sigma factor